MSQDNSRLPDFMPRRGDAPKNILDLLGGAKKWDLEHSDILDKEFVVLEVHPKHHMGKDVAVCTILVDEERKVMLLNSITLAGQLLPLVDELPLLCKVSRKGKRYHFSV